MNFLSKGKRVITIRRDEREKKQKKKKTLVEH